MMINYYRSPAVANIPNWNIFKFPVFFLIETSDHNTRPKKKDFQYLFENLDFFLCYITSDPNLYAFVFQKKKGFLKHFYVHQKVDNICTCSTKVRNNTSKVELPYYIIPVSINFYFIYIFFQNRHPTSQGRFAYMSQRRRKRR